MFISVILTTLLAIFHMIPNVPILTLFSPWFFDLFTYTYFNHSPIFQYQMLFHISSCTVRSFSFPYSSSPYECLAFIYHLLSTIICNLATTMFVLLPSVRILTSPVSRICPPNQDLIHMLSFSFWSCLFQFSLYFTIFILFI